MDDKYIDILKSAHLRESRQMARRLFLVGDLLNEAVGSWRLRGG